MSIKYPASREEPLVKKDDIASYGAPAEEQNMVRTQIYLTRAEHEFLQGEAGRCGEPMAAIIRRLIDERMRLPEDAWVNNPLLETGEDDPEFEGHKDGSVNHDHYVYGTPKKRIPRKEPRSPQRR